ncbi:MAG: 50S ribosomal protein L15 [Candidatus Kapaibacteriales bacterium]
MKHVGNISPASGSKHSKKRIGRGPGSGHGGTSTRGHKGQKSRSGTTISPYFEGGQMPLNRRVPKFGFTNINRKEYSVVNVSDLQKLVDDGKASNEINTEILLDFGLVKSKKNPVKILGDGEISASLNVTADKFTGSAKEKIENAGGTVNTNG